jgi:hypothetical protein
MIGTLRLALVQDLMKVKVLFNGALAFQFGALDHFGAIIRPARTKLGFLIGSFDNYRMNRMPGLIFLVQLEFPLRKVGMSDGNNRSLFDADQMAGFFVSFKHFDFLSKENARTPNGIRAG